VNTNPQSAKLYDHSIINILTSYDIRKKVVQLPLANPNERSCSMLA
jgi:hypothetical protein